VVRKELERHCHQNGHEQLVHGGDRNHPIDLLFDLYVTAVVSAITIPRGLHLFDVRQDLLVDTVSFPPRTTTGMFSSTERDRPVFHLSGG